jgi:hypothetical protein
LEYLETNKTDETKTELINQMIINDCYLENMDKYKLIGSIDIDEILMPVKTPEFITLAERRDYVLNMKEEEKLALNNFKCNRYNSSSENNQIFGSFFAEIYKLNTVKRHSRPNFFNHAYFLHSSIVEQIIDSFDSYLRNNTVGNDSKIDLEIEDTTRRDNVPFLFNVTIRNQPELIYARKMLSLYKNIVKPLFMSNNSSFKSRLGRFDRLYVTSSYLNGYSLGKTFHDTRFTYEFSIHFMERYFLPNSNMTNGFEFKNHPHKNEYTYFDYDYAHLSHYRTHQNFPFKQMPFESLFLDLNVLYCYIMPYLNYNETIKT